MMQPQARGPLELEEAGRLLPPGFGGSSALILDCQTQDCEGVAAVVLSSWPVSHAAAAPGHSLSPRCLHGDEVTIRTCNSRGLGSRLTITGQASRWLGRGTKPHLRSALYDPCP